MPFACISGLTKSCDKDQNFSVIQLKPKPIMVSPSCATQSPEGSRARQNFGKAIEGGAVQAKFLFDFAGLAPSPPPENKGESLLTLIQRELQLEEPPEGTVE